MLGSIFLALWLVAIVTAADVDVPPASSFWVPSLPDIHQNPENPLHIYAGNLPSITGQLYFVLVKNRKIADKDRVLFWFNGGPGCSSFDGLMMEIGPWRTNFHGGFNLTEGGWEEYTNIVYVDQPVGTGFAYIKANAYLHSMSEVTTDLIEFIRNFYKVFPEFTHMDTYLGGESFAGQYIPYFADAILNSQLPTKLRGAAIGNGWIDAQTQYPTYLDFAVEVGLVEMGSDLWKESKKTVDECMAFFDALKPGSIVPVNVEDCGHLMSQVTSKRDRTINGKKMCINVFDIRYDDTVPDCGMNWPPDIKHITDYLDRPEVVKALHATANPERWQECRPEIRYALDEVPTNSSITLLPRVLERIPVLLFVGDQDFVCNYVGMEALIKKMGWNGGVGLGDVETKPWSVDGKPAGTWVSSRNLTYVKIFNASHMAPYDAPHTTHDMILRFMGVNFSSIVEGSAKITSSIGSDTKPVFVQVDRPAYALWESYGTAAMILMIIILSLALFFWCRRRKGQRPLVNDEESIPLASQMEYATTNSNGDHLQTRTTRKGKQRASSPERQNQIFTYESDDEEGDEGKYKDVPTKNQ